ncbi:unnamed protein product [Oppiella nova]|uniref:Aryl hydrocarbon receptor nuclear translocator-like protein 1 n=1 Tax=Oppiella nova TaxID=334625 RepID=A0A7R9M3R9_9ACAR|nr:unnamed protein product [Oppiella nova]CAG2170219.1 unnamed protein product [Oppiella nova]
MGWMTSVCLWYGNNYTINVDQLMDCLDKCGVKLDEIRKQNHSEIEKRRREKMNMLIRELARLVPMCSAIPANRKLDKLTVLRMTVQHIKAIRKRAAIADAMTPTPSFVSDDCVDKMLLQETTNTVTEGFLFVVSCDRGKILYVSDSVKQTLNYNQRDLLGMSWFDVLHHKDIPKVKEQLSLWESFNGVKEKHIDDKMSDTDNMEGQAANNVSPTIESCPGSRRSFFCRMKYKFHINRNDGKGIRGLANKKRQRINIMNDKYCDLYCMGYLKSWTTQEGQPSSPTCAATSQSTSDENGAKVCQSSVSSHTGCLVAMARVMPQTDRQHHVSDKIFPVKPIEYTSRHSMDGMYLFVDQRVTPLLGYLPQELLGTSCYDYCHPDDVLTLAESHRTALHQQNVSKNSLPYRFRTKLGTYLYLTTLWKTFKNPWTREFEYMIAISENVATPDDKTSLCSTTAPKEETTNLSHRKSEAKNVYSSQKIQYFI